MIEKKIMAGKCDVILVNAYSLGNKYTVFSHLGPNSNRQCLSFPQYPLLELF
jgi:hypothetical protein